MDIDAENLFRDDDDDAENEFYEVVPSLCSVEIRVSYTSFSLVYSFLCLAMIEDSAVGDMWFYFIFGYARFRLPFFICSLEILGAHCLFLFYRGISCTDRFQEKEATKEFVVYLVDAAPSMFVPFRDVSYSFLDMDYSFPSSPAYSGYCDPLT